MAHYNSRGMYGVYGTQQWLKYIGIVCHTTMTDVCMYCMEHYHAKSMCGLYGTLQCQRYVGIVLHTAMT